MKITLKIADENGRPVSGAKVGIFEGETKIGGGTSSSNGGFEFSSETDYAGSRLKVRVAKEGMETREQRIDSEEDELSIRLRGPGPQQFTWRAAGEVTDEQGVAIRGAKITIFDGSTEIAGLTSDVDGSFALSDMELASADPRLKVVVTAKNFQRLEKTIGVDQKDLRLQLRPEYFRVAGKVTDKNGEAISAANITIFDGNTELDGKISDADGSFALSGKLMSENPRLKVVVNAEGFQRLEKTIRIEENDLPLRLRPDEPIPPPTVRPASPPPPPPRPPARSWILIGIATLLLVVAAVAGWWVMVEGPRRDEAARAEQARVEAAQREREAEDQRLRDEAERKRKEELAAAAQREREAEDQRLRDEAERKRKEELAAAAQREREAEDQRLRDEAERKRKEELAAAAQREREAEDQRLRDEAERKRKEELAAAAQREREAEDQRRRDEAERKRKEELAAAQREREAEEQRLRDEAERKRKEELAAAAQREREAEEQRLAEEQRQAEAKRQRGSYPGEYFPETRVRRLSEKQLAGWPLIDLQYALNEMYARHGLDFAKEDVKQLFLKFEWYRPIPGLSPDEIEQRLFSRIEKENMELLGKVRNQKREAMREPQRATPTPERDSGRIPPSEIIEIFKAFGDIIRPK